MKRLPLLFLIDTGNGIRVSAVASSEPGARVIGIRTRVDVSLCLAGGISSPVAEEPANE